MEAQLHAMQQEHLRELADRKNTTVFTVQHDAAHEPWPVARLRDVLEPLAARVVAFPEDADHVHVAASCLDCAETVAFKRDHPKFYWLLTDPQLMRDERARKAVTGMLYVREQVECGDVPAGPEADASATKTVLAALQTE